MEAPRRIWANSTVNSLAGGVQLQVCDYIYAGFGVKFAEGRLQVGLWWFDQVQMKGREGGNKLKIDNVMMSLMGGDVAGVMGAGRGM